MRGLGVDGSLKPTPNWDEVGWAGIYREG